MKRPLSVTIIAWYLIVSSVLSLLGSWYAADNPAAQQMMALNPLPVSVQYLLMYGGLTLTVVAAVAMLKRRAWGRKVYLVWAVLGFLIGLLTTPVKIMLVPGVIILAVIAFFLLRPKANNYFAAQPAPAVVAADA